MSRLDEIKKDREWKNSIHRMDIYIPDNEGQYQVIKRNHYDYLIQQVERVEELENWLETSTYIQRMLRKENRLYKQALEEIAETKGKNYFNGVHITMLANKARQALKEGEK